MLKNYGKNIIAALLFLSCIVSGIILITAPAYKAYELDLTKQLDEIILTQMRESSIPADKIRMYEIEVDSIFSRKIYQAEVPPTFSKTLFHLALHKTLFPYDITIPARVHFPDRDMDLYIYGNKTVLRTVRLLTATVQDSTQLNN